MITGPEGTGLNCQTRCITCNYSVSCRISCGVCRQSIYSANEEQLGIQKKKLKKKKKWEGEGGGGGRGDIPITVGNCDAQKQREPVVAASRGKFSE